MAKLRGDDDLLSLMSEMSSQQGYGKKKSQKNVASSPKAPSYRLRLVPEVDGYPSSSEAAGSRSIWNAYVVSPATFSGQSWFPPTNPPVEVYRRRAYEKFKTRFESIFEMTAANQPKSEQDDVTNLWKEISITQILERWHFGVKMLELDRVREQHGNAAIQSKSSTPYTTGQVWSQLVNGREDNSLVDPVLISSGHDYQSMDQKEDKTHHAITSVLRNELIFEWKRSWRRKVGGKTKEEELETFLASPKFQKKSAKLARDIRNLATEVEGIILSDLRKMAAQEEHLKASNKSKAPKMTLKDDGNICLTHSGLSFAIHEGHYKKLQILFDRFQSNSTDRRAHEDLFLSAAYCLLARYDMLQGAGLQSSLHGAVFDVLLQQFDCRMECFASPLNCRYERYCSAFVDTDSPFGSVGSFFDYDFSQGGCFQANPPFAADFIRLTQETIEKALVKVDQPLMFVVFVPAWTETPGWKAFEASEHSSKQMLLSQSSHFYCEGTQYRRKDRYRVASFDSSVFFLQNDAGRAKWPVTEEAVNQLRVAFESNPEDEGEEIFSAAKRKAVVVKNKLKEKAHTIMDARELSERSGNTKGSERSGKTKGSEQSGKTKGSEQSGKTKGKKSKPTEGKPKVLISKKKRKLIAEEAGGDKEQLNILSSLGISDEINDSTGNPEKVKSFTRNKKNKKIRRK